MTDRERYVQEDREGREGKFDLRAFHDNDLKSCQQSHNLSSKQRPSTPNRNVRTGTP